MAEENQFTDDDLAGMSDEEFMKATDPMVVADQNPMTGDDSPAPTDYDGDTLENHLNKKAEEAAEKPDNGQAAEGDEESADAQENAQAAEPEQKADESGDESSGEGASAQDTGGDAAGDNHTTPNQSEANSEAGSADGSGEGYGGVEDAPDYKALYSQIMAPFKANGSEFTPRTPEEVISLMQKGANFTKKMQSLAPNLRMMRMLENNGLLDEQKLSNLIDLSRQDKGAINDLVQKSGIDPLDLGSEDAPAYKPGNYQVSDQEMAFQDAITDVGGSDLGRQTIQMIDKDWDNESKNAIFQEPDVLRIITEQRGNGIYDRITSEMDRQRTLGTLSHNVPFIQAYKQVGDHLQAQGLLAPTQTSSQDTPALAPSIPQPLETRPAQQRKPMPNGDRARAASSGPKQSSPKKRVLSEYDILQMSDEEIMKLTNGPAY